MSLSRGEAVEALALIDVASRRSGVLRGYQRVAPHLMLWGIIYGVGYGFGQFRASEAALAWLALVPVGIAGDVLIVRQDRRQAAAGGPGWRFWLGLAATLLVFVAATWAIMAPRDPRAIAAFVPLVVAVAYIVLGMWTGRRLILTGIGLGLLTLFGFFVLPSLFMIWMAGAGGGALVLGGLWLRRA